jgi:hypothetical protein
MPTVFTKLILVFQRLIKNFFIEFNKNPSKGLVADSWPEMNIQTDSTLGSHVFRRVHQIAKSYN